MVRAMHTYKENDRRASTLGAVETLQSLPEKPVGLAVFAGALAEWEDLDEVVVEIYASRHRSPERPVR